MNEDRCLLDWSVEIGVGEASLESELSLNIVSIALQTCKFSSNVWEISLIELFNFSSVVGSLKWQLLIRELSQLLTHGAET